MQQAVQCYRLQADGAPLLRLFDEAISLFNVAAECLVLRGGSLLGVRGRAQVLPERLPASGRGLLRSVHLKIPQRSHWISRAW